MHRKSKVIIILTVLVSIIISVEPIYADTISTELIDVSLISDLNQTIGKDALNLVDEGRLDVFGSPDLYFTWSPDGTRMLATVYINVNKKGLNRKSKEYSSATMDKVVALYLVNGDGTVFRRITWGEITQYTIQKGEHKSIEYPTWSPSGNAFFYIERFGGSARFDNGLNSVIIIDANNFTQIAKKSIPVEQGPILEWAPKENNLLYLGLDDQYKPTVFLFDISKKVSDKLPITKYRTAPFGSSDLIWSPDGRKIGFEGNGGLFVLDIDTGEVNNIFPTENNIIIDRNAFWSPDNSKIIISEILSTDKIDSPIYDVYVLDVRNDGMKKLTSFENGAVQGWFPDSANILITSNSKASIDSKYYTLYSIEIESKNMVPLFSSLNEPTSFFASTNPTGDLIGVVLSKWENYDFILMNKDGTIKTKWNNTESINWQKDELLLKIVNNNQTDNLVIINASTKEVRKIPLPDPYIERVSWSPAGRYLTARTTKQQSRDYIDRTYYDYLLELQDYDRPMRIEIVDGLFAGTDINILVNTTSGKVGNANVLVNGKSVGTTDKNGKIVLQFNETGEFQISAVKNGYSTAARAITIKDHINEQQAINAGTPASSVPATDGRKLPGFSSIITFAGLTFAFISISKSKRK